MTTVDTTPSSFTQDVSSFETFKEKDIVHSDQNLKLRLEYRSYDYTELKKLYGNVVIFILNTEDSSRLNAEERQVYSEMHYIPEELDALSTLFIRGNEILQKILTDKNLTFCPICGDLVKSSSIVKRNLLYDYTRSNGCHLLSRDYSDETCMSLTSLIPPVVTIIRHSDDNLLYSQRELSNVFSLLKTTEYPKLDSYIDDRYYQWLQLFAEEHPDKFERDIDAETVRKILDNSDRTSSGWFMNLVETRDLTRED